MEKQPLVSLMLGQSSPGIRQRPQRLKERGNKKLDAIMEETWRVYNNWDKQEKAIQEPVVALEQHQRGKHGHGWGRGRGKGGNNRVGWNQSQGRLGPNQCVYCKKALALEIQCPDLPNTTQKDVVAAMDNSEWWGPADLSPADLLVKIQLGNDKEVEYLIDTRVIFSVLNQDLMPKSENHIQVMGSTGQQENPFFLKLLEYKIGKSMGIHLQGQKMP